MARVLLLLLSAVIWVDAANWPGWRGPNSNGASDDPQAPAHWSRTNNVLWRLELPERGNSSPIIWGDRVFVTQAKGKKRALLCVDRDTGKILWEAGPVYEAEERTMAEHNPYCAASPVTDGKRVIAHFGSAGAYCFDFKGKELWRVDLGAIDHYFGPASSPCLEGNHCFFYVGPGESETMVALDKRTGKVVWRNEGLRPRPQDLARVSTNGPPFGSWSTPVVVEKQLVMSFAFRFGGFDLKTGKLLWERDGFGLQTYVTPLWAADTLVAMSGTTAVAMRPVGETLWLTNKAKFRFGSGVSTGAHLYFLSENGLAECWEKGTGKVLWQERLQGPGKKMTSWSSLTMVENKIYAPNQSGDVFVFAAEPAFRPLATNSVSEPTNASLAHSRGRVLMRTDQALWCFGEKG